MARMKFSRLILSALLSFTILSLSPLAHADAATEARVLYQKGNKAFRDGDDVMAREYYRESLALEDSFDTVCNLGRAEARSKLWEEAYEHLRLCIELYPDDPDLADSKGNFRDLRDEVRKEITFEQAKPIDERVDADVRRREEEAATPAESSVEAEPPAVDSGLGEETTTTRKNGWKLPVAISLVGAGVVSGVVGGVFLGRAGSLKKSADDLKGDLDTSACAGPSPAEECAQISDELKKSDTSQHIGLGAVISGGVLLVGGVLVFLLVPNETKVESAFTESALRPEVGLLANGEGWHVGLSGRF